MVGLIFAAMTAVVAEFSAAKSSTRIAPDGLIQKGEYRCAATFRGSANYRAKGNGEGIADATPTECALAWDDDFLYIAARTKTGPDGTLSKGGPRDPAWMTDSIEIWLDPPPEMRGTDAVKFGVFQLNVYWTGRVLVQHHNPGFGLSMRPWKFEGLVAKNTIRGDWWDVEVAIPAAAFQTERYRPGEWGMVLGRNSCRNGENRQLTYLPFASVGAYVDSTCYSRVRLVERGKSTHFGAAAELLDKELEPTVPGNITARVRLHGKMAPNKWRRFFGVSDRGGKGYFGLQENSHADGSSKMLFFYHANARKHFQNFIHDRLPGADEAVLSVNVFEDRLRYYFDGAFIGEIKTDVPLKTGDFGALRTCSGESGVEIVSLTTKDRALSDDEIVAAAQGDRGLAGELKWYPSRLAIACELRFPVPEAKSGMPRLEIFDAKGVKLLEQTVPSSPETVRTVGTKTRMMVVHELVKVAETLPEGEYRAWLVVNGKVEIEKVFRYRKYPWFDTPVARKEILMPGFTALKARDDAVECVGRRYVFAASGLPKEIWTDGKQILAGAVEVKGLKAGNAKGPEVLDVDELRVDVKGSLAKGHVEQDGFYVFDLALPETEGPVTLEIPVKAEYAKLYHACAEGLRMNPAGFVPAAPGRFFASRSIPQTHIENFIPYVFVGTDTRGICYAADTDQGWVHAEDRDAVELHRGEDGTVTVRLNLIATEGRHAARTIRLALMATPAKPMPKGWRGWVDAYDVQGTRNTLCNCSTPTWGCYTVGMGRYPTYGEYDYTEKVKETSVTGKVDTEWTERWIERCWKDRTAHPELVPWLVKKTDPAEAMKSLRNHAYAGFRRVTFLSKLKGDRKVLYYYTCNSDPCDGLYEFEMMRDEWGRFTSVFGSYQDYAIHYLKEMCEHGMNGVYDDNTFFRANYDWVAGNAWIDEKGEVHPSFQLFANREFNRRQVQAMLEAGVKEPWLTVHHTNANIIPTLSHATNTMGMEWKYGSSDYQDRYSRDYIRTVNQGYQGGFFATSLEGIFGIVDPAEKTRVTRTMLAALLPHEVQPTLQAAGDHALVKKALSVKQQFGVGEDDCEYRAYYDPENWIVQPRDDVMVSVYRRKGEYLAVIGSYAEEDVELVLRPKRGVFTAATDPLDGTVPEVRDGAVVLPLKRRDFAMIRLR